ncbi:MAG: hypothetical protein A2096_05330, partial [Spirochaetes bacterium GWF1_41_5]
MKTGILIKIMFFLLSFNACWLLPETINVNDIISANNLFFSSYGPGGGGYCESLSWDPSKENTLWVGGDVGGTAVSFDNGVSYEIRNRGLEDYWVECFAINPNNSSNILIGTASGVHRTVDQGLNWILQRDGFPVTSTGSYTTPISSIVFDPGNTDIVYAAVGGARGHLEDMSKGKLYKSANNGITWTQIGAGTIPADANIKDIEINPVSGNIIFIATDKGLFRSIDSGVTWVLRTNGLPHKNINKIALAPSLPTTVYCTMETMARSGETFDGGVYKSYNSGDTWYNATGNLPTTLGDADESYLMTIHFKDIKVSPDYPNVVYAANYSYIKWGIYKSTDGGSSWKLSTIYSASLGTLNMEHGWVTGSGAYCMDINQGNPDKIVFGTSMAINLTENNCTGWKQIFCIQDPATLSIKSRGWEIMCLKDIIFDKKNIDKIYFCFSDVGLLLSEDYGSSYKKITSSAGHCYTMAKDPDLQKIWVSVDTSPKLRMYQEISDEWIDITPDNTGLPDGNIIQIILDKNSPVNSRRLIAAVSGYGIYESENDGVNWENINGNLPAANNIAALIMDPQNSYHLLAGLKLNAAAGGGIYSTTGSTWTKLNTADIFYDLKDLKAQPDNFNILYICQRDAYNGVSYNGGVYKSINGGKDWSWLVDV